MRFATVLPFRRKPEAGPRPAAPPRQLDPILLLYAEIGFKQGQLFELGKLAIKERILTAQERDTIAGHQKRLREEIMRLRVKAERSWHERPPLAIKEIL